MDFADARGTQEKEARPLSCWCDKHQGQRQRIEKLHLNIPVKKQCNSWDIDEISDQQEIQDASKIYV